jgi:hypothetical protein
VLRAYAFQTLRVACFAIRLKSSSAVSVIKSWAQAQWRQHRVDRSDLHARSPALIP